MNRSIIFFFTICSLIFANAQIKVTSNGNVHVGKGHSMIQGPIGGGLLLSDTNASYTDGLVPDSLATLVILGPEYRSSWGYISFGNRADVSVEESGTLRQLEYISTP